MPNLTNDQIDAVTRTATAGGDALKIGYVMGYCAGASTPVTQAKVDAAVSNADGVHSVTGRAALATLLAGS